MVEVAEVAEGAELRGSACIFSLLVPSALALAARVRRSLGV